MDVMLWSGWEDGRMEEEMKRQETMKLPIGRSRDATCDFFMLVTRNGKGRVAGAVGGKRRDVA